MKVFVYGTLMKNNSNHYLLENSKYLGEAKIKGNLYNLPHNSFPVVFQGNNTVIGEVYEIDENTIERLDCLEGYNPDSENSLYFRKEVKAYLLDDMRNVKAFVYLGNVKYFSGIKKWHNGVKWDKNLIGVCLCGSSKIFAKGLCSKCYQRQYKQNKNNGKNKEYKGNYERNSYIVAKRKEGKSFAEIGEELGLSRQRVEVICKTFS